MALDGADFPNFPARVAGASAADERESVLCVVFPHQRHSQLGRDSRLHRRGVSPTRAARPSAHDGAGVQTAVFLAKALHEPTDVIESHVSVFVLSDDISRQAMAEQLDDLRADAKARIVLFDDHVRQCSPFGLRAVMIEVPDRVRRV